MPLDPAFLEDLIAAGAAARRASWTLPAMGAALGGLLAVAILPSFGVTVPPWLRGMLFWILAGGLGALLILSVWQQRRALQRVDQASHLIQFGDLGAATVELARCLRSRTCPTLARAIGLVELGQICLRADHAELAERAFELALHRQDLLSTNSALEAQLGLAEAKLRSEQLTDAHEAIGRLQQQPLPQLWQARVSLLYCLQQLIMGQPDEISQQADALWHRFREHLGTDAGFGYGLLAAAMDRSGNSTAAARFWSDATLLLRPQTIVERYPLLRALKDRYKASQWPW